MPAFLSTIEAKLIALAVVVVLSGGGITYIYKRGENAGSSDTRAAVSNEAVKTIDNARQSKEKANEEVRRTPLDVLIDGKLR